MENVKLANMCMIIDEENKKVVVQDRIKSWKGIAFPGGKLELGEAIIPSTVREIKEETGLDITDLQFCGIKNWYDYEKNERYMVFLLKTSKYNGELFSDTPEGKVSWIELDKLKENKLASDFSEMVDVFLGKNIEFFYEDTKDVDESNRWIKRFY